MKISHVIKWGMKGHSLARICQNADIEKTVIAHGSVIDLGSKDSKSSYFQHMTEDGSPDYTFVDYFHEGDNIIKADLEKPINMSQNSFDTVLLFNVLEHIYNTKNIINESFRILKEDGVLYGGNPFMYKYHRDPSDFWRFTHEAMERMLIDAGFSEVRVIPSGVGSFTVAANQVAKRLRFKPLIAVSYALAVLLDRYLGKLVKRNDEFYLGIVYSARKPTEGSVKARTQNGIDVTSSS